MRLLPLLVLLAACDKTDSGDDTAATTWVDCSATAGLAERSTSSEIAALEGAATDFIALLDDSQRADLFHCLDDEELYSWTNIDVGDMPRTGGVEFGALSEEQLAAAYALFGAFLSAQGLEDVETIINVIEPATAEKYADVENRTHGVDYYTVVVFGNPGSDGSWGVQLDGHHLAVNMLVHGDEVSITPAFSGADPKVVGSVDAFADEEAPAYALITSLSAEQLTQAVLSDEVLQNIITDNAGFTDTDDGRDKSLGAIAGEGIAAADLDASQQAQLRELIAAFVGDMDESLVSAWDARVEANFDATRFAYAGEVADGAGMYFRVYSPALLIEYIHSNGETGHPHAMVREPNADGDDETSDYGVFASTAGAAQAPLRARAPSWAQGSLHAQDPLRAHLQGHAHHAEDRARVEAERQMKDSAKDPAQQLLAMARGRAAQLKPGEQSLSALAGPS